MDWTEILITLACIVLGAIGSRRKKAAREVPQRDPENDAASEPQPGGPEPSVEQWIQEIYAQFEPKPSAFEPAKEEVVEAAPQAPKEKQPQSVRPQTTTAPANKPAFDFDMQTSEEKSRWTAEEKRKLILYSEIMKPKYTES